MSLRSLLALTALILAASAPPSGAAQASPPAPAAGTAEEARYRHDVWTSDQGLPENTVNAVVQTRDGYLWIGTYEGLVRFDGVQFVVFDRRNTPALTSNAVYKLLEDREGALWIATNGGGVVRQQGGVFTAFTSTNGGGLKSDVVRTIYEDRRGQLWIGTDAGLHRRQAERFEAWSQDDGLNREPVRAVLEDHRGVLWVGSAGGGVRRVENGRVVKQYRTAQGLAHDVVRGLHEDRQGRLWIGTGGGLDRLEGESFTHFTRAQGLPNDIITIMYEDREGTLWVGTNGGGPARLRDDRVVSLSPSLGLADTIVYAFLEDREGSLWVGTYVRGLHRLRRSAFSALTTADGLAHDLVKGVLEARDGSLWIGTNGGGLSRLQDGHLTTVDQQQGLSTNIVISVLEDARGDVWAGTYLYGLNRLRGGRVAQVLRAGPEGLINDHVTALLQDARGALWIGTYGGGLNVLRAGRLETVTQADGLPNDVVRTLHADPDGSVWVGTNDGLARVEKPDAGPARVQRFGPAQGLRTAAVMAVLRDEAGGLWVGTRGGGLSRLQGREFKSCTTRQGLFDDVVYAIVDDGLGYFWMSCDKGLFRVPRRELDEYMSGRRETVRSEAFDKRDGLPSSQCSGGFHPSAARARDGRLWFPTIQGLVAVDPRRLARNTIAPPVAIEQVKLRDRTLDPRQPVELQPGQDSLEIHYTGLSFVMPERVRFKYRLEGLDPDWVDAGTRRVAFYTNVPPGPYTFRVMASNNDGVWNETGASLPLTLRPRVYQRPAFHAFAALLAVALAAGAYRLRLRQLQAHQRELRLLVEERTRRLQEEKERAETASAELARTNSALSEANAVKSELLSIAAHDLRNPLQLVMGYAELIAQAAGEGSSVGDKAIMIYRSSRRMLNLVSKLVEASVLDSGEFRLALGLVDLGALVEGIVGANRPLAVQKAQPLTLSAAPGCLVEADEERLREVADNLVNNAIKYSPPARPIHVSVEPFGGRVRLVVSDEGPGLSADDLARIFGKFQRLSAQPTGGETTTGLGLSIVKRLVELHGGAVWAESAGPGRGSRFVVELPAASAAPQAARA